MEQLILMPSSRQEAGKKGYQTTIRRMGKFAFHSAGGQKTAGYDLFMCGCHGVGVYAYSQHNKLKGKKHRYAAK